MNAGEQDVHTTLEYRSATAVVRVLPVGLLLIFLGLVIWALMDTAREPIGTFIGIGACFVFGIGVIGLALWTRSSPGKPLYALSPAGIHGRIPWVREFLIPWREVRGVDSADVEATHTSLNWSAGILRRNTMVFHDVTVVLVPKQLYDTKIFVDSFLLRGPGWNANFIPKGDMVQVALHHEILSVEPQPLREAVAARWLAFRDQPITQAKTSVPRVARNDVGTAAPKSNVVAMGESPRSIPWWDAVAIVALSIGIVGAAANIAGAWDLPGQGQVRETRAKAQAERQYWSDANRRMKEEWKKRDADEVERRREFDRDMRRAFGR